MSTFYPLDTARYRLQGSFKCHIPKCYFFKFVFFCPTVENPDRRKATSTFELLRQLVDEEGFATLYRGLVPVLQSLCISNFVYFYTFHSLKAAIGSGGDNAGSALRDLCLGSVAGIVNVLTTTPFWVVNTRLKMKGLNEGLASTSAAAAAAKSTIAEYSNLLEGLSYIWRTEGVAGLWAGTVPSLMLVSNPALQFMMYEALKRRAGTKPSAFTFFAIGALAKTFATIVTYPLQLIQTKLRHGGGGEATAQLPPGAGIVQMCLYILKNNGVVGLFRGLEAKLLQTVLTAALMFAAYEKIAATVMSMLIRKKVAPK